MPGNTTIAVDAKALRQILEALVGPPHLIRELQVTRSLDSMGLTPENRNPINVLIEQYQSADAALAERGDKDA